MHSRCFSKLLISLSFIFSFLYTSIRAQEQVYIQSLIERFTKQSLNIHPRIQALKDQADVSHYLLKVKRISWLNRITLQGNLNEFNIQGGNNINANFFPRYNFGITIPLGIFFTTPREIKVAKTNYLVDLDYLEEEKANLRNQISDKVQEYMMERSQNVILQRVMENSKLYYLTKEKSFRAGTTSLKAYSEAKHQYLVDLSKSLQTKRDLMVAKYDLEYLIGQTLDEKNNL
jgi:outer membrane protein TolC